jgi:hypothetical protein
MTCRVLCKCPSPCSCVIICQPLTTCIHKSISDVWKTRSLSPNMLYWKCRLLKH